MNVYFVCQIFDSHLRNEFLKISAFTKETCFVSQGLVKSDSISDVLLASANHSEVPQSKSVGPTFERLSDSGRVFNEIHLGEYSDCPTLLAI